MVSPELQMAVSQRYVRLANAITHAENGGEKQLLAPHFRDRAKIKLSAYEYDPLTVLVQRVRVHGNEMIVKAYYVGVHGKSEVTFDRWLLVNGSWRLAERDATRR